ncbi:MAG TPA: hypothetical protein VKY59_01180 [Spirillospora sp.]|nr:hypothetical protein [Spirillospora sp.]
MTLKRWTYVIGFLLVGVMGLSTLLPVLAPRNLSSPVTEPVQPTPMPTFPPPPDTSAISFDQLYLHPSGLFTVAYPTGWTPSQPITTTDNVRAVFSNTDALGVIQVDINRPPAADEAPLTLDNVDSYFNTGWMQASWREYSSWEESSRQRTADDELVIDFALTLRGQTYVARQKAWTDGDWIYSTRVVMPENATQALLYLLDNVAATLEPQKAFAGTPLNWEAYFDQQDTHIIRFPSSWTLADSAPGKPASITGEDNTALRVQTEAGTVINSEADARAWVENLRSGTNILSVKPVSREGSEGYSVAYTLRTVDGDMQSGLAVLLNGPEDRLHVANLRFPGANIDLNADDLAETYSDLVSVMNSFNVMPHLAGAATDIAAAG